MEAGHRDDLGIPVPIHLSIPSDKSFTELPQLHKFISVSFQNFKVYIQIFHIIPCLVFQENFEAILKLLQWSWNTFHSSLIDMDGLRGDNYMAALSDLKRVVYICKASLCLLRIYVTQIYPDGSKASPYKYSRH